MISLHTFVIVFIALAFIARVFAELYVYYTEHKESPQDAATSNGRITSASQQSIHRYYSMKGARNHTNRKGA